MHLLQRVEISKHNRSSPEELHTQQPLALVLAQTQMEALLLLMELIQVVVQAQAVAEQLVDLVVLVQAEEETLVRVVLETLAAISL